MVSLTPERTTADASGPKGAPHGYVSARQGFPVGAAFDATLEDASRADAAASVIASTRIPIITWKELSDLASIFDVEIHADRSAGKSVHELGR